MRNRIQHLQCPFCSATSTRGTGLSAHVRARHPKQYKTWNRNPNRLIEASGGRRAAGVEEPEEHAPVESTPVEAPAAVHAEPVAQPVTNGTAGEANGHEPISLLQRVHDQLAARKNSIESEIARIEALRIEHESVIAQLAAVDQAMSAFRRPEESAGA